MPLTDKTVLVVEDDPKIREMLERSAAELPMTEETWAANVATTTAMTVDRETAPERDSAFMRAGRLSRQSGPQATAARA